MNKEFDCVYSEYYQGYLLISGVSIKVNNASGRMISYNIEMDKEEFKKMLVKKFKANIRYATDLEDYIIMFNNREDGLKVIEEILDPEYLLKKMAR